MNVHGIASTTGLATAGNVDAAEYLVNHVLGKSTDSFTVQANVNGSLRWVGLKFDKGILTGASF